MDKLKQLFKKESGIDLTDYKYVGKFPKYNSETGRWGNIPRGQAWQLYAEWLESKFKDSWNREEVIKLIKEYSDFIYKGYYVQNKDVEDILDMDDKWIEQNL